MVPGQFFVPSGTWLSQLDNQKHKKTQMVEHKIDVGHSEKRSESSSYIILEKSLALSVAIQCTCYYPSFHSLVHWTS